MTHFISPNQRPQVEMLPGVHRRNMALTEAMLLCEIFLERDARVPEHSHPHQQTGYVVRGQLQLTIAGQTRTCNPGDSYQIPGDVPHSATALQDTVLIDVFSPPREEYL